MLGFSRENYSPGMLDPCPGNRLSFSLAFLSGINCPPSNANRMLIRSRYPAGIFDCPEQSARDNCRYMIVFSKPRQQIFSIP